MKMNIGDSQFIVNDFVRGSGVSYRVSSAHDALLAFDIATIRSWKSI